MCDPVLVTLLKLRPHYSQSSRANATPSSGTSPLATYKEVPPPPPIQAELRRKKKRSKNSENIILIEADIQNLKFSCNKWLAFWTIVRVESLSNRSLFFLKLRLKGGCCETPCSALFCRRNSRAKARLVSWYITIGRTTREHMLFVNTTRREIVPVLTGQKLVYILWIWKRVHMGIWILPKRSWSRREMRQTGKKTVTQVAAILQLSRYRMNANSGERKQIFCFPVSDLPSVWEMFGVFPISATPMVEVRKQVMLQRVFNVLCLDHVNDLNELSPSWNFLMFDLFSCVDWNTLRHSPKY